MTRRSSNPVRRTTQRALSSGTLPRRRAGHPEGPQGGAETTDTQAGSRIVGQDTGKVVALMHEIDVFARPAAVLLAGGIGLAILARRLWDWLYGPMREVRKLIELETARCKQQRAWQSYFKGETADPATERPERELEPA